MIVPMMAMLLTACQQADSNVLAQVGEEKLTLQDVLLQMPLSCHDADSVLFVEHHVDQWIDEQLLYQMGMKNLPNLDELERQAAQYRRDLIARTYQTERLAIYSDEVTDEECRTFYDKYRQRLKLDRPIVQGIYVRVLSNSTKVNDLKTWLKEILHGQMDHAEDLEQFCQQRAVDYDSFTDQWVDMRRLTDRLPNKVVDAGQFLKCQVYQMKDADYIHIFMVSDFRLKGEIQPFDFCQKELHDLLVQHKQTSLRGVLLQQLRDEAQRTGELKTRM